MPKVTARINVRGIDLSQMIADAKEKLSELTDAEWKINEVDLYGDEDISSRQGMARLWSASMSAEANIKE